METLPGVQHIKGIAHKILIGSQPTDGSAPNLRVFEQRLRASQPEIKEKHRLKNLSFYC